MTSNQRFATADDVFQWMKEGCARGIQPGLQRMEWMLSRLNHPERRLKCIHVAGTNGKGSTAAMIASVLQQAGYPTGLFTSPFLTDWKERIRMDGVPIDEEAFVRWANRLRPLVEEMAEAGVGRPTEFEFWTMVALCWFARDAVPWFVVWETGLGGRLDSTNVVFPLVSVITNVGRDHMNWLGDSIREIAREKAGIIKPGVPVVTACEDEEALQVLHDRAKECKSRLYRIGEDFTADLLSAEGGKQRFDFTGPYRRLENLHIPLMGEHQVKNAATALMTLEVLRQYYATVLEDEEIRDGLRVTRWPGRLEIVSQRPRILLDGAHNPEGAEALARALHQFEPFDRLFLLIGMMKDKATEDVLRPLLHRVDRVVTTQVDHPRSLPAGELSEAVLRIRPSATVESATSPLEGLERLKREAGSRDLILVTGTLFLVAEVRKQLSGNEDK